jgi:hypothetical protein
MVGGALIIAGGAIITFWNPSGGKASSHYLSEVFEIIIPPNSGVGKFGVTPGGTLGIDRR